MARSPHGKPEDDSPSALDDVTRIFRLALDNARDAIFIDDTEGRLVYANSAFFSLYGFDPAIPLHEIRLEDYIHEDDVPMLRERHDRRIRGEEVPEIFSYRGIRRDGTELSLEVRVTPVEQDGRVVGTHSVVRDITARLLLEDKARQAQKMESIGRLAAGIAHDFNNILQGIQGHATLAQEVLAEDGSVAEAASHLDVIVSSSGRAGDLVRQLLGFARQGRYRPEVLNVNDIVTEALDLLETGLRSTTPLEIVRDLRASQGVRGDPTQIHQIVQNLTINARDAMPEGGTITVRTLTSRATSHAGHVERIPAGSYVIVQVSDDGVGISPEIRDLVFEPFYTTKHGKSTGLGLSTVFGIVKRHDGFIELESEPGEGTTLSIYFPAVALELEPELTEPTAHRGGERILVVDDELAIRDIACKHLSRQGYEVVTASDGPAALREFEQGGFALVIVDLLMSPMDGAQLFRELRALDTTARVAIMSGYFDDSTVQELLTNGAVGFVQKPFRLKELSTEVARWLSWSGRQHASR